MPEKGNNKKGNKNDSIEQGLEANGINTAGNLGITGKFEDIADVIAKAFGQNEMATTYAIIFGGTQSPKSWKDAKNQLKAKNLFTVSSSIEKSAKSIAENIKNISTSLSNGSFQVPYLKYLIKFLESDLATIIGALTNTGSQSSAGIALTANTADAEAIALLIDSMTSVKDEDIKRIKTLLGIIDKINNSSLADTHNISPLTNILGALKDLTDVSEALKRFSNSFGDTSAKSIQKTITELNAIINGKSKNNIVSLLESISKLKPINTEKPLKDILAPINEIAETIDKVFSKDYSDASKNAEALSVALEKLVKILENLPQFDSEQNFTVISSAIKTDMKHYEKNMEETLESQEKGMAATKAIIENADEMQDGLEEVTGNAKMADQHANEVAINGLSSIIVSLGTMVIIGSLIAERHPTFIRDSMRFGAALVAFTALVLIPIMLVEKISDKRTHLAVEGFGGLVFAMGGAMIIGAMIYKAIGDDFSKYVWQFTVDLTLFMLGISLSLALMSRIMKEEKTVFSMTKLITRCAIVMTIGALFVMSQGGALVKASLLFGVTLGLFILCVTIPLMLYSLVAKEANENLSKIAGLVVTCTLIMLIGALFVRDADLVINSLKFGLLLGVFIALVLAPIWLFSKRLEKDMMSIKRIGGLILEATVVLMIGGWFMTNRKLAEGAIKFAMLLSAFIIVVSMGIAMGSMLLPRKAAFFVITINRIISTAALCLIVGGVLMSNPKIAQGALEFAGLFIAFIIGISFAMKFAQKWVTKKTIEDMQMVMVVTAIMTAIMVIGALCINHIGWESFAMYIAAISIFMVAMAGVFALVDLITRNIKTEFETIALMAAGIALLAVAFFLVHLAMQDFEWNELWMFSVGVAIMVGIFAILGAGKNNEYFKKATINGLLVGAGIALLGFAFGLIKNAMEDFEWEYLLKFLAGVGSLVAIFAIIGIPPVALLVGIGSIVAAAMGGALMTLGIGFGLVAQLANMDVNGGAAAIKAGILALSDAFTLLGENFFTFVFGAIAAKSIGRSLQALSIGFGALVLIAEMDIETAAQSLDSALLALAGTFSKLGTYFILYILASVSAGAMSASIIALSIAFGLLSFIDRLDIETSAEHLNNAISSLVVPFTAIGVLVGLFVLASVSAGAMTASIIGLSLSFALLHKVARPHILGDINIFRQALLGGDNNIGLKEIFKDFSSISSIRDLRESKRKAKQMAEAITALSESFAAMHEAIGGSKGDKIQDEINKFNIYISGDKEGNIGLISILTTVKEKASEIKDAKKPAKQLSEAIGSLAKVSASLVEAINASKSINSNDVNTFGDTLTAAINIFKGENDNSPFGDLDEIKDIVKKVKKTVHPMVKISSDLFKTVKDFATLQIPDQWNPETGIATHYITLDKGHFTGAADSIAATVSSLIGGFKKVYDDNENKKIIDNFRSIRSLKSIFEGNTTDEFSATIKMTKMLTEAVSGIAQSVSAMAKLMVADDWNSDGKPIHYHQLIEGDFETAADNVVKILETMLSGIAKFGLANSTLLNKFANDDYEDSIIGQTIIFAKGVGEIISNISTGVSSYAKLMIPDAWNKEGRPTHFRQLKQTDFTNMTKNIELVLSGMMVAVATAVDSPSFKKFKDPEVISDITSSVNELSNMLGGVARTIVDYSSLRIPVFGNPRKSEPTSYRTLTPDDFIDMAANVEQVLTKLPEALYKGWQKLNNMDGFSIETLNEMTAAYAPMTEMLANMAKAIKEYASMKKMPIMDKDGKIVSYIEIDLENDLKSMGTTVSTILKGMCEAVNEGYNMFLSSGALDSEEVSKIIRSIQPITNIFESLIKIVQGYADLKIPRYGAEGKITGYTSLVSDSSGPNSAFAKLFGSIKGNFSMILSGLCGAIEDVINDFSWLGKENSDFNTKLNSFNINIGKVLDPVSQTIELIKKYSELKFPTGFTTDGKVTGYYTVDEFRFDTFNENIKEMITAVPNGVKAAIEATQETMAKLSSENDQLSLSKFEKSFDNITGFISDNVMPIIQSFIEWKIPTEFDGEGKPKKYFVFDKKSLANLETTIKDVICAIPNAVHKAANSNVKNNDKLKDMEQLANIIDYTTTLCGMLGSIYGEETVKSIMNIVNKAVSFNNMLDSMSSITNNGMMMMLNIADNIKESFKLVQDNFVNGLYKKEVRMSIIDEASSVIDDFFKLMTTMTSMNSVQTLLANYTPNSDNVGATTGFAKITKDLAESSASLLIMYENLSKIGTDGVENAKNMMSKIREEADNITSMHIMKISGEAIALDAYVKAVNKVEVKKVDSMTKMFDSMNKFSASVGNLNKFTTVLATKIAAALAELTVEMQSAEQTISKADKLRKEREKTMEKTLSKIQTIMSQTLNVTVSSSSGDSISGSQTFGETN